MSVIGSAIFTHVCIDIGSAVCHWFRHFYTCLYRFRHVSILSVIGSAIDLYHDPNSVTPATPSLWGSINMGLYNMGLYHGGAVSAWGCIGL